ncbi:hypothetical protein AAMO2058_001363000 [Amorphochlora amoebiformis]|eukprot:1392931-Amorphochlora_amoeboformis.AAC.1
MGCMGFQDNVWMGGEGMMVIGKSARSVAKPDIAGCSILRCNNLNTGDASDIPGLSTKIAKKYSNMWEETGKPKPSDGDSAVPPTFPVVVDQDEKGVLVVSVNDRPRGQNSNSNVQTGEQTSV